MKIVAFVPAKKESERIESKNLSILDGEYLFKRKLRQLLECDEIDDVYLDTNSDLFMEKASDLDIKRLVRPDDLATNAADGHDIFEFACSQVPDADIYIQCLCTAPFVDGKTISRALAALRENPDADSLVGVHRGHSYVWENNKPTYGDGRIPNSVDLPETITEGMCLYMVRHTPGEDTPTRRFGKNPVLFDLSPLETVDINYPDDLLYAESISAGQRAQENIQLNILKSHLSSSILSDVCKELGIKSVVDQKIKLITGGKVLGRAKTLKLKAIPAREKKADPSLWKGIYEGLNSYKYIRPGDVIMVANEVPTKAYFGDLNANLAIRSGASAAIIDGFTRDTEAVGLLNFNVYAHDSYCDDIKYEGTIESMNKPVEVGGIDVRNNDYIFADCDGIVVVPQKSWPQVEALCWETLQKEAEIKFSILKQLSVNDILDKNGPF